MNGKQIEELVLQSLEHEMGGINIYRAAIACAVNPDLAQEWKGYLAQTEQHVTALTKVCKALGIDPKRDLIIASVSSWPEAEWEEGYDRQDLMIQGVIKAIGHDRHSASAPLRAKR